MTGWRKLEDDFRTLIATGFELPEVTLPLSSAQVISTAERTGSASIDVTGISTLARSDEGRALESLPHGVSHRGVGQQPHGTSSLASLGCSEAGHRSGHHRTQGQNQFVQSRIKLLLNFAKASGMPDLVRVDDTRVASSCGQARLPKLLRKTPSACLMVRPNRNSKRKSARPVNSFTSVRF